MRTLLCTNIVIYEMGIEDQNKKKIVMIYESGGEENILPVRHQ
jgi:predicted nucleic acid-binding protein